ncbi:MAG: DegT/DnrJ/EryC1/StrS family aminotransferase [Deltaproteobacteria bacterium]|nr:DegT/DnrJ/EryC1/StrS family aminotransferase [Deltaproteobacteria bacterium]MBI3294166.1 DegT/DnrJ/EryC1/StrS family aminotransferase [Deltaproteobacteria bacterium]
MRQADPMTQGRHQDEFEKKFCRVFNAEHAFAVATGTAALELSAILCRLKPGDEVILPVHTFAASAIPFGRTGAKLVWADSDRDTFLATAATLEPLITPKTRAIVVVHLYGLVSDMDPILLLARKHNLLVVEDAAQSIGAAYKGRPSGTLGDFGCYSLHTHKNISTLGEGGVLTVRDAEKAKLVPGLRHNGMRPFEGARERYWVPAMSNIDFDFEGFWPYNFCLGEIQCGLGSALIDRVASMNADRAARAERVRSALKDYPEVRFQKQPDDCGHSYHLLPMIVDPQALGRSRNEFMDMLVFEYGIRSDVRYCPLNRYPLFQKAGFGAAQCPNANSIFDNMISLPFQHWMTEEQEGYLISSLKGILDQFRSRRGV